MFSVVAYLSQSIGVTTVRRGLQRLMYLPGHIGHDDENVLLQLIGKVFGRSQRQTGRDDTLNTGL